jgi:hypothetical protein
MAKGKDKGKDKGGKQLKLFAKGKKGGKVIAKGKLPPGRGKKDGKMPLYFDS